MSDRPSIIDHDREEPPRDTSRSPWGLLAVLLIIGWTLSLFLFEIDWHSVVMGAGTAFVFTAWGLEYTGNKVPASWRRKPPGSRRP